MWPFLYIWVLCPVIFGPTICVNPLAQHLTGSKCPLEDCYYCSSFPPSSKIWFLFHSFQDEDSRHSSQAFVERRELGRIVLLVEPWRWKVLWDLSHTHPQTYRQHLTEPLLWCASFLWLWQHIYYWSFKSTMHLISHKLPNERTIPASFVF